MSIKVRSNQPQPSQERLPPSTLRMRQVIIVHVPTRRDHTQSQSIRIDLTQSQIRFIIPRGMTPKLTAQEYPTEMNTVYIFSNKMVLYQHNTVIGHPTSQVHERHLTFHGLDALGHNSVRQTPHSPQVICIRSQLDTTHDSKNKGIRI